MNIIDTFLYVFKSDSRQLIAEQKQAEAQIDKTTDALESQEKAAESASAALGDFANNTVVGLRERLVGLAQDLAGVGAAFLAWSTIKGVTLEAAEAVNGFEDKARELYMSVPEWSSLSQAITSVGGSAEGLASTLQHLEKRTKQPVDELIRLADKFVGLSDRQADKLGKALGIDQSLVDIMRDGSKALSERIELHKELFAVTTEQVEIARKYKLALDDTNIMYDDMKRRIMSVVLPVLTQFLKGIQAVILFVREHKEGFIAFFSVAAGIILARMVPAILAMGAAWLRASAMFLATPLGRAIAIIMALAAAIGLIVDDIAVFEEGGNSLVGLFAERWPIIGTIVHNLVDVFKMFREIVGAVMQYVSDVIHHPGVAMELLRARVMAVLDAMIARFPVWGNIVKTVIGAVVTVVGTAIEWFGKLLAIAGKVLGFVGGMVGNALFGPEGAPAPENKQGRYKPPTAEELDKQRSAIIEKGKSSVNTANAAPTNNMTSSAISNTKNATTNTKNITVQEPKITINTQSSDPQAISKEVAKSLSQQTAQMVNENDTGIVA